MLENSRQAAGGEATNRLTQLWPLPGTIPTCQERCAHWCNSGISGVGATNSSGQFWGRATEGKPCLALETWWKAHSCRSHQFYRRIYHCHFRYSIKLFSIYIYIQRLVLLSLDQKRSFFPQWVKVKAEFIRGQSIKKTVRCWVLNWIFILFFFKVREHHRKEVRRSLRARGWGGKLWNIVFWMWCDCWTHELTVALLPT